MPEPTARLRPELSPREPATQRAATGTATHVRGVHTRARHRHVRSHADRRHDYWRPAGTRHPGPGEQRPRLQGGVPGVQEQAARRLAERGEEAMNRPLRITLALGEAGQVAAAVAGAADGLDG